METIVERQFAHLGTLSSIQGCIRGRLGTAWSAFRTAASTAPST